MAAVLLTVISAANSYADWLDKINKGASEASKAVDQFNKVLPVPKPAAPTKPSTKTNQPAAALPKVASPTGNANTNPPLLPPPATAGTNELAFPILPDGSLFLTHRIFSDHDLTALGAGRYSPSNSVEALFGNQPSLTSDGKRLLSLAHGLRDQSSSNRLTLEDIVMESRAYRGAHSDFERQRVMVAVTPVFERALVSLKQVTNVSILLEPEKGVQYSLKDRRYNQQAPGYLALCDYSDCVGFVDARYGQWQIPESFPFPLEQAEQINDEQERDKGYLTAVVLMHGVFCSQEELSSFNERPPLKRTRLFVRITTAEAFLVMKPLRKSGKTPWVKSLGKLISD